jgi:hypothetical protein
MINVGTGNVILARSRIEASSTFVLQLENSVSLDSRIAKRAHMATRAKNVSSYFYGSGIEV